MQEFLSNPREVALLVFQSEVISAELPPCAILPVLTREGGFLAAIQAQLLSPEFREVCQIGDLASLSVQVTVEGTEEDAGPVAPCRGSHHRHGGKHGCAPALLPCDFRAHVFHFGPPPRLAESCSACVLCPNTTPPAPCATNPLGLQPLRRRTGLRVSVPCVTWTITRAPRSAHSQSGFQAFEDFDGALGYRMKPSKRQPPAATHKIQGVRTSRATSRGPPTMPTTSTPHASRDTAMPVIMRDGWQGSATSSKAGCMGKSAVRLSVCPRQTYPGSALGAPRHNLSLPAHARTSPANHD